MEEGQAAIPIVPKARKLNYSNFVNRFSIHTEIPVVEALMVNFTLEGAVDGKILGSATRNPVKLTRRRIPCWKATHTNRMHEWPEFELTLLPWSLK